MKSHNYSSATIEFRLPCHAEDLFAVMSDPNLYEFVDLVHRPLSLQALRQRIEDNESRKSPDGKQHWLNWIIRNESGVVSGFVQATVHPSLEADIAYSVASIHWRHGLARSAVEKLLFILSSIYFVERYCIVAERANVRSINLAKRLGFVEVSKEASARHALSASEVLLQRSAVATQL